MTVKTKSEETLECDVVLSAAGVVSNIENIGLEECGIVHDRGKIVVDDYYATNIPSYYAIGDCARSCPRSSRQRRHHLRGENRRTQSEPIDYSNIPGCVLLPEVASVGMTEDAAKEAGHDIKVSKFRSLPGKASAGHKDGFVKLIFDAKYGELLGGHMIGANVPR